MHSDRIEEELQGLGTSDADSTREFSYLSAAVLIAVACLAVVLAILLPKAMIAEEARTAHEAAHGASRFVPNPRLAEQHRRELLEQRRDQAELAEEEARAAQR